MKTRSMRFHRRIVATSSADASSWTTSSTATRGRRLAGTDLQCMPDVWEWAGNDMEHIHAQSQEGYMVVLDPAKVELRGFARDKEWCGVVCFDPVLLIGQRTAVPEALLRRRDRVVKPCGVHERRMDLRVGSAEQVEQDEMLYRAKFCRGCWK